MSAPDAKAWVPAPRNTMARTASSLASSVGMACATAGGHLDLARRLVGISIGPPAGPTEALVTHRLLPVSASCSHRQQTSGLSEEDLHATVRALLRSGVLPERRPRPDMGAAGTKSRLRGVCASYPSRRDRAGSSLRPGRLPGAHAVLRRMARGGRPGRVKLVAVGGIEPPTRGL